MTHTRRLSGGIAVLALLLPLAGRTPPAAARDAGEPIRMTWTEGDVAGFSAIYSVDGQQPLGVIEYTQRRRAD
jgi:hypothetical protein